MVRKPWYLIHPDQFAAVRLEVEDAYPDLRFIVNGQRVVLRGYYPLFEGSQVYDRYLIEVEPDRENAKGLSTVREIGGRIPWEADRHVYAGGAACVALPDAFWYEHPKGMTLLEFLGGPMRGYFAAQSLVELGADDPWGQGEWDHNAPGIIAFYKERLDVESPVAVWRFLGYLSRAEIKGHWPCPCGSGQRLRQCHGEILYELRSRIPRDVATRSEKRVVTFLREALAEYQRSKNQAAPTA